MARQGWGLASLDNPVMKIKKPAPGKARERRLEDQDEARLLAACRTSKATPWLETAVGLAIETGMRAGELLSWAQVRLQDRAVRLDISKEWGFAHCSAYASRCRNPEKLAPVARWTVYRCGLGQQGAGLRVQHGTEARENRRVTVSRSPA